MTSIIATSIDDDFDENALTSCEYEASEAVGCGTTFTLMPVSFVNRDASATSRTWPPPTESPTKVIFCPPYFAFNAFALGTAGGLTTAADRAALTLRVPAEAMLSVTTKASTAASPATKTTARCFTSLTSFLSKRLRTDERASELVALGDQRAHVVSAILSDSPLRVEGVLGRSGSGVRDVEQRPDDLGIELRPGAGVQLGQRLVLRQRAAVRAGRRHGAERVAGADDAGDLRQQAADALEHLLADDRVPFHQLALRSVERAGLVDDRLRDAHLADVVKERRELRVASLPSVETEPVGHCKD